MADDELNNEEQMDTTVPEMWALAKPPAPEGEDEDAPKPAPGPKVGKLVKFLNDIEEIEELEQKLQERDPATKQSLLMWATLTGKFVLVEWLVKKGKRSAFAFHNDDKSLTVYDEWTRVRKEIEERERERLLNPPEEEEAAEDDDEEKAPEPTADQLVFEALSEHHEEWGNRAQAIVKSIGELGVYQGHRDEHGTKCGLGQTLFPDGDLYCGEYQDNRRHGTGTYAWSNQGMMYCGAWNNNVRDGVGRMVYPDGGRYYGAWRQDHPEGVGRYTYPDGSSYNGNWHRGVKQGEGTLTFTDGSQYIGSFVDGNFVSGEWKLGNSGTRYIGTFANGAPTGKGVFVFRNGKEGTFRQVGEYIDGKWVPGTIATAETVPTMELVVQQKTLSVGFSSECGALSPEDLVRVVNFEAFRSWLSAVDSTSAFFVDGLSVTAVQFDASRNVTEVRLKVVAVDPTGKRLKNTGAVVLKKPTTQLLLLLVGGDKTLAVVEQLPLVALQTSEHVRLPTIQLTGTGVLRGAFAEAVAPALRVDLTAEAVMPLPLTLRCNADYSNATQGVVAYIQHVHADTVASAQAYLDKACDGNGFVKYRAVRLNDVAAMTTDAITAIAANYVMDLSAAGKLPAATVAAQRPPTPIPPPAEARPDIEPLLEAERAKNAAPAADDE